MSHTKSRYMQDLGFTDGRLFAGPGDVIALGSTAAPVVTRNAVGDWSLTRTSAGAETLNIALNITQQILRRTGFFEDLQEQFGGAGIPASAEYQGRPDTIPSMALGQPVTPRTAFKLKGFKLLSVDSIYRVTVAGLTTNTFRVDQTNFVNNIAPAVTAVLAPTGIPVATQANPYVANVVLPTAQQIYRIGVDQELWIEMTVAIPNTSKLDFYGFDMSIEYNFN
jgi:hypothetical protein